MLRIALTCILASTAAPAFAQEDYLDDRSNPAALVRSLYNAINREEYARAWSYFSQPPAENVEAYARGYDDTERVELIVGSAREEGAAGSLYFEIPVAIRADIADGPGRVFAGCYTLRMADPTIGEEFEPLHLERGDLRPSDARLEEALPRRCGDGPDLPEHDAALEQVKTLYAALPECDRARGSFTAPEDFEPEIHPISFRYEFDDPDRPERTVRLFRFLCYMGAYNVGHVYFLEESGGEVSPLHFARPALDIRYADGQEENVESMTVTGFSTYQTLVNSEYDPETRTIEAFVRWRGVADASSAGRWIFRYGQFELIHYEVDASYDWEQNPEVVVDYETGP